MSKPSAPLWAQEFGCDEFGQWASFAAGRTAVKMRWIPPGQFWMGSPEDEDGQWDVEVPRHLREIKTGFWLSDAPCTQALWMTVMGVNPSECIGLNRPVECVSWHDCLTFCIRLTTPVAPRR